MGPRHMVGEPRGVAADGETQIWPLQQAQQVVDKMCCMVQLALSWPATQLALVMLSVLQFPGGVSDVIPKAPALQESQVVQLVPFCRSGGTRCTRGSGGDTTWSGSS